MFVTWMARPLSAAHCKRSEDESTLLTMTSTAAAKAKELKQFKLFCDGAANDDVKLMRRVVDGIVLKLPVLGPIMRKIAVARFCRTLSTLLSSGVPILDGLDITARTAGNAVIEEAIQKTRTSIERGETVSGPLRETNVFPSMVVQMINVGETTGALDAMLSKIADFYEEEVDTAVAGLLTLMEPIMIAVLGGVVGGIVIAMYMPIFDLISKLT